MLRHHCGYECALFCKRCKKPLVYRNPSGLFCPSCGREVTIVCPGCGGKW